MHNCAAIASGKSEKDYDRRTRKLLLNIAWISNIPICILTEPLLYFTS